MKYSNCLLSIPVMALALGTNCSLVYLGQCVAFTNTLVSNGAQANKREEKYWPYVTHTVSEESINSNNSNVRSSKIVNPNEDF